MIEVFKSFDLVDWLLTGGLSLILTSAITILVMVIKQRIKDKADITQRKILNESTMTELINLGKSVSTIVQNVQTLTLNIDSIVDVVNASVRANQESIANIASFVLECFNASNLSDEKKTALKSLFERTFFADNQQFVESLKAAKLSSETALNEAQKLIDSLRKTVQEKDVTIATMAKTTKARRI